MSLKLSRALLATIGYVLSPLSWWNDAFVNLPIAYCIGLLGGLASPRLFSPAMIGGYWLTNIAGLVLLHRGIVGGSGDAEGGRRRASRRQIIESLVVSTLYTILILLLVRQGIVRFPGKDGLQ